MVEHFLGKEEVPSSILGNSSKPIRQPRRHCKVSSFFVVLWLMGTCSQQSHTTTKKESVLRSYGCLIDFDSARGALEERGAKGDSILGNSARGALEERGAKGYSILGNSAPAAAEEERATYGSPILGNNSRKQSAYI